MADWDDQNGDEGNFTKVDSRSRSRNSYEEDDRSTKIYDSSNDNYRQSSERKKVQSNDNYLSLSDEEKRISRNKKILDEIDSQMFDKSVTTENEKSRRNYEDISPYKTSKQNNDETEFSQAKNEKNTFDDEETQRQKRKNDDDFINKKSDLTDDSCSRNRRSIMQNDDWNNENENKIRNDELDSRRFNSQNENNGEDRKSNRRSHYEDDQEDKTSTRKNFDSNNDNFGFRRNFNDNDGENRRFNKSNNNEDDGERRSFRRNDNEGDDRRSNRRNDNDGEGERRSFRRNDNDGDDRRSNRRNDNDGEGERRSFRRNDNDGDERRSNRRNDNEENRGSRRNFDNEDGENADDKPKEKYIPPTFSKEDDELFYNITEGINFSKFEKIPVKKVGEDIPDPIESFSDATKNKSLHDAIFKSNYKTLTPIQKHSIPIISNGRDLMAAAQTGSGKTVTFLLPLIEKLLNDPNALNKEKGYKCSPEVVIISPTRELAIQIYQQALKLTFRNDIKSSLIYGGANFFDQKNRLSSDSNIVVATPGRLAHFLEKDLITFSETKYLVLDEADRLIDQGFIPQVENIVFGFDLSKNRQTLMFSATFSETVQDLAKKFLKDDFIFVSIGILGAANSDVEQEIILTTYREKKNLLLETVKKIYHPKTKILVFTEKKKTTDFIALTLSLSDFQSISFHGDRLQSQREQALDLFKKGETPILVATSAASRGLDIKGVEYVINYDIPKEVDEYVHRIGRTGRLGNFGKAISFYDPDENSSIKSSLVKVLKDSNQNIPDFLNDGDNYESTNYSYNTSSFPEETKYEQKNEVSQQVDDADDW